MTTPTNIRFTAEESAAIDGYAKRKDLRRTSAVRELVRIGLQQADGSGLNVADALRAVQSEMHALHVGHQHLTTLIQHRLSPPAENVGDP